MAALPLLGGGLTMRSFRVHRVPSADVDGSEYRDVAELECRACLPEHLVEEEIFAGSFVLCHEPKVGQRIHCPDCGELSIVPKKARWS